MSMNKTVSAMCLGLISVVAISVTPAMAVDSDGCWSGRYSGGSCLEYHAYQKNNKTYIKLNNRCNERLYMKWCAGGKCGADGLRGGQTKTKYEFITTSSVMAKAVGSTKSSKDWVCSGKVNDWHDDY